MKTVGRWAVECVAAAVTALAAAAGGETADLLDSGFALGMAGQAGAAGRVDVAVVPAPDGPSDMYSLRMRFRLDRHVGGQWINAFVEPSPPLDFSSISSLRLPVRAEQETPFLRAKLVDPDNPGPNHSAFEAAVSDGGAPLPAGRWVDAEISLPPEPARRDGLTYVGFYIPAADERIPLNRDMVIHVGRFPLVLPTRPEWPPPIPADDAKDAPRSVWAGTPEPGPWALATGGGRSVEIDGRGFMLRSTANGWNELLRSDPDRIPIRPGATYRLSFDYRVVESPRGGPNAMFYSLARAHGTIERDAGWQQWAGSAGGAGRRTIAFTPDGPAPYHLIFGVRHRAAIWIGNIDLRESASAPEAAP